MRIAHIEYDFFLLFNDELEMRQLEGAEKEKLGSGRWHGRNQRVMTAIHWALGLNDEAKRYVSVQYQADGRIHVQLAGPAAAALRIVADTGGTQDEGIRFFRQMEWLSDAVTKFLVDTIDEGDDSVWRLVRPSP